MQIPPTPDTATSASSSPAPGGWGPAAAPTHEEAVLPPEVEVLLDRVPEFTPRYRELVEAFDDEPGAAAAFTELADVVAFLALDAHCAGPVLQRAMAAVEEVAATSPDAEELVGWCFLQALAPEDLDELEPWMGPATRRLRRDLGVDDDEVRT